MDKETEEVMNLVGKCSEDDQCLTVGSSSNPNSVMKKSKKKQQTRNCLQDSQSLQTSVERTNVKAQKSKLTVLKTRMENSVKANSKNTTSRESLRGSSKSTKVQMILERHRKLKYGNSKQFRPSETMEDNRSKIHSLTNQERRSKNKSNMSVQPPNSQFLSFTMESGLGINKDQKSKLNNTAGEQKGSQNFYPSFVHGPLPQANRSIW